MAVAALAVAPMMGWSTRHARALARIVSRHTVTYSEMVTDSAVLRLHARGDEWSLRNLVAPDTHEAPSVLQLGGCNPETMRRAARVLAERGASYSAVNLNCGCPSPAVATDGSFGAALMFEPPRIAALCTAIAEETRLPVSVKCRIGVDAQDSYEALANVVGVVAAESPVRHFIVHARKCLLRGLSAKENRTVPPLQRDRVVRLARDFPHLSFTLNGGVASIEEAAQLLAAHPIRGVMIGRAAASTLHMFAYADARLFGDASRSPISRSAALLRYAEHARVESAAARNAQISDARFVRHRRVVVAPALSLIGGLRSHKPLSQWLTHQLSSLPAAICASDILRNLAARVAELEKIEAAAAAEAKAVAASQRATVHLASSL